MAKIVQTADRDRLGDFAPQFAHFNDDVLFGEEWNNEDISPKTRSIITISVFIGRGLADSSLLAHLKAARPMESARPRSLPSSPMRLFTPGGPSLGPPSIWPSRSGTTIGLTKRRRRPARAKPTKIR